MRIQFLTSIKSETGCQNLLIERLLSVYVESHAGIEVANESPDVVHLFGRWNNRTVSVAKQLAMKKIPVVFTSADGLQSMAMLSKSKRRKIVERLSQYVVFIHVTGPLEKMLVEEFSSASKICKIANPAVTSSQTEENLCDEMLRLYQDTAATYDARIRQGIRERVGRLDEKDPSITAICSHLLYAEYQVFRGTVSQISIDSLCDILSKSQYDEDRLADCLLQLGIYDFVARMMQVAASCSSLTEGFMPIPALNDKQTERIVLNLQTTTAVDAIQSTDNQ